MEKRSSRLKYVNHEPTYFRNIIMRSKFLITLTAVLALILSFPVFAHITEKSDGWTGALLHPFTGIDHLLMMLFIGVAIVYNVRKFRKLDK